ncbi:MAG: lipopolysaccharide heptosyltransferase I [Deltaproteobacteria bacterium HGW-Deltaproteobacteria-6]|jgi:3-deoxy-D-manno-octulosonic-acid transferase/heptosyltransferase-1|nr:MAG: lipopolysaccharide heptosyltransferase I [Deltaproteobacteria bacterium HGW-Deltaproteobacteria-6]
MNILIVKLSAIGDVIHTLPSLTALRRLFPDAHITWAVEEAASDLVIHHPCLDEVLISRRKSWIKDIKAGKFPSTWREIRSFVKQLRQRQYDIVIDFHGLLKSSVIVFLSRGKRKLGYDSWQELSGLFLNEKIPEDMNKHAVDRYLDFARYLGAKTDQVEFTLPLTDKTKSDAERLLNACRLKAKQYIAVNPIAFWETKLWNNEKFARLADLIQEKLKLDVVFTGSNQADAADILSRMTKGGINLGGQTSLLTLAEIYKNACAVITTDSGPMHLAAAVGTPVIALFGPTDPARTGPYGAGHSVVRSGLSCSPCLLKKCSTTQCMKDITEEQVLNALIIKLRQMP